MKPHLLTTIMALLGSSGLLYAQVTNKHLDEKSATHTHLLFSPGMAKWKPPVEKDKVWSDKNILDRFVQSQGGRHVCFETCATEIVPEKVVEIRAVSENVTLDKYLPEDYYTPTLLVGVSATVYKEGSRVFSKVRVTHGKDKCEGWSNIDFNHFRGTTNYVANGREYYQLGGYGNMADVSASEAGCPVNAPELNGKNYDFIVTSEGGVDETNSAYLALLDMHALYAVEKKAMAKYYRVMLKNQKLSSAWHKANPPQPKDITIRFWKRQTQNSK